MFWETTVQMQANIPEFYAKNQFGSMYDIGNHLFMIRRGFNNELYGRKNAKNKIV